MQIQISNFIQVPASLEFATISEFSRHTIHKLITAVTSILIAFLIEINKKLDQIFSKLPTLSKYFTCSLILFCTCGTFLNIPRGYLHYNWKYLQAINIVLTSWCLFKWTNQNWWTNQISQSANSKTHSW